MAAADRQALITAGQATRDRARLATAAAELAMLRRRVEQLEASLAHRALRALRRLAHRPKRGPPAAACQGVAGVGRGLALVIDHAWPRPDRDAGSIEIVMLVNCLQQLGFTTVLAASEEFTGPQPARAALEAQGITCLTPADAESAAAFIASRGASIDLCVLCRVFCGGEFLELVERHCVKARIIYNSIDLNYLREERRAKLHNDAALQARLQQAREREEHVIRQCDATVVVSQREVDLLATAQPDCCVVHMPLSRTLRPPKNEFASRAGFGFIGSFLHSPNADGLRYFLKDIWPLVQRQLPGCAMSIVGADVPEGLLDGVQGPVTVLGHLPDVGPWFESVRLTVAPLRFGAGAKGKVASSLAAGVPCVATSMAAEGMALHDAGVIVADDPAEFAAAICRLHEDQALWQRLSQQSLDYAGKTLTPSSRLDTLDAALVRLGL